MSSAALFRQALGARAAPSPRCSRTGPGNVGGCALRASPAASSASAPRSVVARYSADSVQRNANETQEEKSARRARESAEVSERIVDVMNGDEWDALLEDAGDRLIVLEVTSDELCQTGLSEEAEMHWKEDKEASMIPCQGLRHSLVRTARDCPDVVFANLAVVSCDDNPLAMDLGIDTVPTVQFYRSGEKLWEHKGHLALQQDIGEGLLYYGDVGAGGSNASDFVKELHSIDDIKEFAASQPEEVITVVDVSLKSASPCIHIFPAVLALAKNMQGFAAFARIQPDETDHPEELLKELSIVEVPTFLFFKGGKEVHRFVGSSRGDLIGQILGQQARFGVQPPTMKPSKRRVTVAAPNKQPAKRNPFA